MGQHKLTKFVFWQLISFANQAQTLEEEFDTFAILFEFAKTQGIKNTMNAFKALKKHEFLTSTSPIFKRVALTKKSFFLTQTEDAKKLIEKNNWYISLAEEKGKQEIVKKLRGEIDLIKILITEEI
ncbi:hypothetical protein [Bernardetia sp.]|uniref:hypothetical protein n=1 Tax=Bernardetia sp. TaxID=1937974 RepID=UPI0025C321B7|nr:hypothetical protein [Bernardetia sp.]